MVAKFCSRSQGQPVPGVRSAAMISSRREMSREGRIGGVSRVVWSSGAFPIDRLGYPLNLGAGPAYTARRAERPFYKGETHGRDSNWWLFGLGSTSGLGGGI